jgi:nitroreductase
MKKTIKIIIQEFYYWVIFLCSRSMCLSNIFYFIFSDAFKREHHAVLSGRYKYLSDLRSGNSSFYQLIRNTHRIEKGLLMKPRREVFALGYIEETIDSFIKIWTNGNSNVYVNQLKWSHDVLKKYFEVVSDDNKIIQDQKEKFFKVIKNKKSNREPELIPYSKKSLSNISFEDFYNLSLQRRSTRFFEDKKVPRQLIDKAIMAARQSPSACNRQPFEYRVIDDPELLKEVVHFPGGTSGYANNIPGMIISVGNLNAYFSERDRHLIYIDASLANMSMMLALETLGLSSCSINWPDVEEREKKMKNFLNLKDYQRPIMCLAVGYADPEGKVAYSEKKELERIRKYN